MPFFFMRVWSYIPTSLWATVVQVCYSVPEIKCNYYQNALTFRVDPVFPRNYFTMVKCISWK